MPTRAGASGLDTSKISRLEAESAVSTMYSSEPEAGNEPVVKNVGQPKTREKIHDQILRPGNRKLVRNRRKFAQRAIENWRRRTRNIEGFETRHIGHVGPAFPGCQIGSKSNRIGAE